MTKTVGLTHAPSRDLYVWETKQMIDTLGASTHESSVVVVACCAAGVAVGFLGCYCCCESGLHAHESSLPGAPPSQTPEGWMPRASWRM